MLKAVLLCGGLGTRLHPLTQKMPKPLVPIAGRPLLDYQLVSLQKARVTHVYINVLSFPEQIQSFVGDGSRWGMSVTYARETKALGTAGALRLFSPLLDTLFFVVYSDVLSNLDLRDVCEHHRIRGAAVTAVVRKTDHPMDSDLVQLDDHGFVTDIFLKPHPRRVQQGLGMAACYVMNPAILSMLPSFYPADIVHDFLTHLWRNKISIATYQTDRYIRDIGTPDRLQRVERDIYEGRARFT